MVMPRQASGQQLPSISVRVVDSKNSVILTSQDYVNRALLSSGSRWFVLHCLCKVVLCKECVRAVLWIGREGRDRREGGELTATCEQGH